MTSVACALALLLGSLPAAPAPTARLLDRALELRGAPIASDVAAAAGAASSGEREGTRPPAREGEKEPRQPESAAPCAAPVKEPGALDFDLLGAPPQSKPVDEDALHRRRSLLTWHQGVGLGMFALQLATTAVGQLNYDDKFGASNSGKYVQPHAVLAYSTLAAFVAAGTLALLAPSGLRPDEGVDRVRLHKVAMFTAAAGMLTQGVLGIWTKSREGYLNQQRFGTAHLAVGYITLVAVGTGVGLIVF